MTTPTIIHISIAFLIILIPLFFFYRPPKKMNGLYGYRTPRSMENQKYWDMAQRYASKLFLQSSILTILCQIVFIFLIKIHLAIVITLGVWLFLVFITILKTEAYLKHEKRKK